LRYKERGEWFLNFFNKIYYETYRPYQDEDRNYREACFIAKALDLPKGSRILDIGCGYARHAVYLAKMGYEVVGIDISDYLLNIARERVKEFGVKVDLVKKDMRALDYHEEFDGAYMFYTTFGYFSEEENREVINRVSRALKLGGRFLVDIWNKYRVIWRFVNQRSTEINRWHEVANYLVLEKSKFDLKTESLHAERAFIKNGKIIARKQFTIKTYSYGEMIEILNTANLKIVRAYGSYDGTPFEISSPRLILVAEKVK